MRDWDDPEPEEKEEVNEALEQLKALRDFVFSKKTLQGVSLFCIAYFSWQYTGFFKEPDACLKAQPKIKTNISINNPNIRWKEFKGLALKGIAKTRAEDGNEVIERSYDLITGKSTDTAKLFLLKDFVNTYDMKAKGCVESITLVAKIQTLSGAKAMLNDIPGTLKLTKRFLNSKKPISDRKKLKNRTCNIELVVNRIDPTAQGAQVPIGNITMSCG